MNADTLKNRYYKNVDAEGRYILVGISIAALAVWGVFSKVLFGVLSNLGKDARPRMTRAVWTTVIIGTIAILYTLYRHSTEEHPMSYHLGPDYHVCQVGPDGLSGSELKDGAVGYLDYPCDMDVYTGIVAYGNRLRSNAFYVTYVLFALLIFLYNDPDIKGAVRGDEVLLTLVKLILVCSLATITASRFSTHWLKSIYYLEVGLASLFMMVILTVLVLYYVSFYIAK